ncbi:MAG: hypothetical protein ACP5N1_02210 [Candidatus Woesearchaeota archaeon]
MDYKNLANKILEYTYINNTRRESYIRLDTLTCTRDEKDKIEQKIEDTLYVIGGKEEMSEDKEITAKNSLKHYRFPGQKVELTIITAKDILKKTIKKDKDKITFTKVIILHNFDNNSFYNRLENIISNYTY